MDILRKALDTIALRNLRGDVSDELLVKACDSYKDKAESFDDSYEYNVYVTKSIYDFLHGNETDAEISKAILPGQTKVIDGVVYIYTATPNAKTAYDWRVYKGKKKIGRQVDDDSKVKAKQDFVNELFPSDLSVLKVVKNLGGSTGAKLVEDDKGNQFVMKRGDNTSNEHVKNEYLANQLYDLLGVRVPDYELYDDNGEAVMLSKFIPMTTMPSYKDYDKMAENFVADALLANWDIYQNDNCLIDSAGRVIRVDNGGTMEFRAQGSQKNFNSTVDDFDSMIKYNPSVVANLTDEDYINQIDEIVKRKDDIRNFLRESNVDVFLEDKIMGRVLDLEKRKKQFEANIAKSNRKVLPRTLLPENEMYRDFTDEEIEDFWKNAKGGKNYYSKLRHKDTNGWSLLEDIAKSRGFDARPLVVEDDEFWKGMANAEFPLYRGVDPKGSDKHFFVEDFKYNDDCFYGSYGVHGAGIYFHVNDGDKNKDRTQKGYKKSDAYKHARSYAASGSGGIIEGYLAPDAKVAKVDDLRKEIANLIPYNTEEAKAKQKEIAKLETEFTNKNHELSNLTSSTENDIKQKMKWDENTLVDFQLEIDSTDWGAIDEYGDPDYPKFDDFVKKKMFSWVENNGGEVTEKHKDSYYILKLPNSKETFTITRYQYENNAIKRKSAFANPYNYPVERFSNWLMKNHYQVIEKEVTKELKNLGEKTEKLQKEVNILSKKVVDAKQELKNIKTAKDPDADILSGIQKFTVDNSNDEAIGVYAALKGYDAIIRDHGNGGDNSFMIVINRSKVTTRKKIV